MALLIAGLALEGDLPDTAKIGAPACSMLSAIVGLTENLDKVIALRTI